MSSLFFLRQVYWESHCLFPCKLVSLVIRGEASTKFMVVHNVNSSVEICLLITDFMVKISYLVLNIFSCLVPVHHPKSTWLRPWGWAVFHRKPRTEPNRNVGLSVFVFQRFGVQLWLRLPTRTKLTSRTIKDKPGAN